MNEWISGKQYSGSLWCFAAYVCHPRDVAWPSDTNDAHLRCYGNDQRSINWRLQLALLPDRITTASRVNFPLDASGKPSAVDADATDNDGGEGLGSPAANGNLDIADVWDLSGKLGTLAFRTTMKLYMKLHDAYGSYIVFTHTHTSDNLYCYPDLDILAEKARYDLFHHSYRKGHCLNHLYRCHAVKNAWSWFWIANCQFDKRNFTVRSLFNYVWFFSCIFCHRVVSFLKLCL